MRKRKTWEELTLKEHFMFARVMQNPTLCRRFLSCIHGRSIGELAFTPQTEKIIDAHYDAKSIRLDVFAQEVNGALHDLELQNTSLTAELVGLRARYYRSSVDQEKLNKGENYKNLPQVFIIFVCDFDPFDKGLRRYTFSTRCTEDPGLVLPDKTVKIFLNIHGTQGEESPDMLAMFAYMVSGTVQGEFVAALDAEVQRIKADEQQRKMYMTLAMYIEDEREESYAEGKAEGKAEGEEKRSRDIAGRMLDGGLPLEQIAAFTGLSVEQVRELQR